MYGVMVMCMDSWSYAWSHGRVYGVMVMCMESWSCIWSQGRVYGVMVMCVESRSCVWSHVHVYGVMVMCMESWSCVWSHGILHHIVECVYSHYTLALEMMSSLLLSSYCMFVQLFRVIMILRTLPTHDEQFILTWFCRVGLN